MARGRHQDLRSLPRAQALAWCAGPRSEPNGPVVPQCIAGEDAVRRMQTSLRDPKPTCRSGCEKAASLGKSDGAGSASKRCQACCLAQRHPRMRGDRSVRSIKPIESRDRRRPEMPPPRRSASSRLDCLQTSSQPRADERGAQQDTDKILFRQTSLGRPRHERTCTKRILPETSMLTGGYAKKKPHEIRGICQCSTAAPTRPSPKMS